MSNERAPRPGRDLPLLLYGTAWKEERTADLVLQALRAGFRAIDTANQRKHYHEAGVGAALKEAFDSGLLTRDELFLQTKYTYQAGQDERLPYDPSAPHAEQVRQSFASSLDHLGVEQLDSLVLHGPSQRVGLGDADHEAWGAMEEIHASGGTRHLGASNINPGQLRELCSSAHVKPTFVQNRCFADLAWDREVRDICDREGITYQGFSLLTANRGVWQHPWLAELAARLERTPSQVIYRFAYQVGMWPMTGTTDPQHVREALEISAFELDEGSVRVLLGEEPVS